MLCQMLTAVAAFFRVWLGSWVETLFRGYRNSTGSLNVRHFKLLFDINCLPDLFIQEESPVPTPPNLNAIGVSRRLTSFFQRAASPKDPGHLLLRCQSKLECTFRLTSHLKVPRGIKNKTYFKKLLSTECQLRAKQKHYQSVLRLQITAVSAQTTQT